MLSSGAEPQGTPPGVAGEKRCSPCIRDYLNPVIRQLRDQQVRFAPREKKIEQVDRAEKLLGELDAGRTYTYEYLCYRITDYRPESFPDLKLSGEEAGHDLRLFVEDVSDAADRAGRRRRRAGADGRRAEPSSSRSRPRRFPAGGSKGWSAGGSCSTAASGSGFLQSSVDRFVASNRRARPPRSSLQPADRRGARRDHRAGAAAGPRRRLPVGRHPAARQADGPQRRDDPLHAQAVRPASTRIWRSFPTATGPLRRGDQAEDLPAVPPRRRRSRRWPSGICRTKTSIYRVDQRDAGPADHGAAAGLHPQRRCSAARAGREGDAGRRCRPRTIAGQEDAAAQRVCRPIWPACTRCRC